MKQNKVGVTKDLTRLTVSQIIKIADHHLRVTLQLTGIVTEETKRYIQYLEKEHSLGPLLSYLSLRRPAAAAGVARIRYPEAHKVSIYF